MTSTPPHPVPPPNRPRPTGPGNPGLIIAAVIGGIVVIAAIAGVGVWFLLSGSDTGPGHDTGSSASPSPDDRPRVDDGAPATEVRIESIRMTAPSSSENDTEECEYEAVEPAGGAPENPDLEDVGRPKDGDQPAAGSQDMTVKTGLGDLVVEVDNGRAPCTAASYTFLSGLKFFDDSKCHRLTTKDLFVLQCGDPSGTGRGGPTYQYDNEYVPKDTAKELSENEIAAGEQPKPNYKAGAVAMANSGADTNGSQFFIVYEDTYLPPGYTIFGELTSGLDLVKEIADNGAVAMS